MYVASTNWFIQLDSEYILDSYMKNWCISHAIIFRRFHMGPGFSQAEATLASLKGKGGGM